MNDYTSSNSGGTLAVALNRTPVPIQAPQPGRRLTKLQFVDRMTQTEFTGLLTVARTDADAEMFVKMLDWATPDPDGTSVDLDDPRTIAGVQASFSAERAAQILA